MGVFFISQMNIRMNYLIFLPLLVLPYYFTLQYLEEASFLFITSVAIIVSKQMIQGNSNKVLPIFMVLIPVTLLCFQSEYTQSRDLFLIVAFAWGTLFAWSGYSLESKNHFIFLVTCIMAIGFLDLLHITHFWNQTYIYHEFVLKSIFSQKNEFAFFNTLWLTWYLIHGRQLKGITNYIALALFTIGLFYLLVSNAKSAIMAFGFVITIILFNKYSKSLKSTVIGFSLLIITPITIIAYFRWNIILKAFDERLFILKGSYRMMVDFFPGGAGIGSFPFWIKSYFETGTASGHLFHKVVSSPHNFILDFLIDLGLWGGVLLVIGFYSLYKGLKSDELKKNQLEYFSYWSLIILQGLMIQPISFQPMVIFFIGYIYYKSTEYFWQTLSLKYKFILKVNYVSMVLFVFITFNYGVHLYRTKELNELYDILRAQKYVDMPRLLELRDSGYKNPKMDRLFFTHAAMSSDLNTMIQAREHLLEKTNYLYPLEFSFASVYASKGMYRECLSVIDLDLEKFGKMNYASLNLKAECLAQWDCNEFLDWKSTMDGFFGISLDYKRPIWYLRSCSTPLVSSGKADLPSVFRNETE